MKTCFFADPHFFHENVIEKCSRPFNTVAEMNAAILDEINKKVERQDILYCLGDVIHGVRRSQFLSLMTELRSQIRCRTIHLIYGNHDKCIRNSSKLQSLFTTCKNSDEIRINGRKITLSHCAHCVWPSCHYGAYHFYAHSHGGLERWREQCLPEARMFDVGVDYRAKLRGDYGVWTFEELDEILSARKGHQIDRQRLPLSNEVAV